MLDPEQAHDQLLELQYEVRGLQRWRDIMAGAMAALLGLCAWLVWRLW